jgi:hypothetical protein
MRGNDPTGYLQKSSRRRILSLSAGALATGVAGCVEYGNEGEDRGGMEGSATDTDSPDDTTSSTEDSSVAHEFKSPPYENIETEEGPSSTTVSGRIVLEAGQYAQYNFELEESTQVQITGSNEGEGTMDLFLLSPESELSTYMDGKSADFSGGFTETDFETVDRSLEVSSGDYFLVFDNSVVYGAEPEGAVASEFEMILGDPSPSQPKIREVTDNFGHTFSFSRDASDSVRVDDEVVVSDDTAVELCVTDVAKQEEDDVVYSYWFGNTLSEHPDNVEKVEDNCNSWDMQRSDYQSDWGFKIWISNGDEIGYQNEGTDYRAGVYYTNLTLEE